MRIHILSDLHLEFAEFQNYAVDCDVIVLAGDIQRGTKGIRWARKRWPDKEIIYVAGNHEYYRAQYNQVNIELAQAAIDDRVHLLSSGEVIIKGVRFLGATLWTDFKLFGSAKKLMAQAESMNYLADFRVILFGKKIFTPKDSVKLHKLDLAWLESKLTDKAFDGKTVVVTHHLPSRRSVADRYADKLTSSAFASDLSHLLGKSELWIHGHTHDSFDYIESGTRVICNPRGYVKENKPPENAQFNPVLVVDI